MRTHIFIAALAAPTLALAAPATAPAHAATLSSSTHPDAVIRTFDDAPVFSAYVVPGGVPSGAQISLVKSGDGSAVQMRNGYAGSFSVDFKVAPFDAQKLGDLYFDYKLQPDVKVNIFFRLNGVYHCAVFSGPPRVRPGGVLLGNINGTKADGLTGAWRRAHIPLRDWLRTLYPTAESFPIDEIVCGNWDNSGYLVAGFGGNGAGATWQMDNFAIVGPGPGEAKVAIQGAPAGATYTLDSGADAPRPAKPAPLGESVSLRGRDGLTWVFARDKSGAPLGAYAVEQAASAPKIGDVSVDNNKVNLAIAAPRGLDNTTLSLEAGGRKWDRNAPELSWRGDQDTLVLDAGRAGLTFHDHQKLEVKVSGVRDLGGREAAAAARTTTVEWKAAAAKEPAVPRLKIEGIEDLQDGSFEHNVAGWTPAEAGGALVERDDSQAHSGRASIRLGAAANATPFRAWIRRTSYDVAKYPVISFWYKTPANMRADILVGAKAVTYGVAFTDKHNPSKKLGAIQNVVADNTWHYATFDLATALKAARPGETDSTIEWLAIGDTGWLGNARGTQYFIDDFRYVPAVPASFKGKLEIDDVTGIKAVAWQVDDEPQTEIPLVPSTAGNLITATGTGLKYVHARIQNGAGEWTPTAHIPVFLQ